MKVQLLYFPGCPNVEAAREQLRRVVADRATIDEIDTTAPDTPASLRGWGSPTILVDGIDVAGGEPSGSCCRLYPGGDVRGAPSETAIRAALDRAGTRHGWWRSLALVPGAFVALLPTVTCPACLAGYAALLSSAGLGFLFKERVQIPLIGASLLLGIGGVAWSTRSHRRPGPMVATIAGSVAVVVGRLALSLPAVTYLGVALLVFASIWNLWLKRPPSSSARRPPREEST
jgi:hypothetical protein